jgi:hypothetical protein
MKYNFRRGFVMWKWIRQRKQKRARRLSLRDELMQSDWYMKGWEDGYAYYRNRYDKDYNGERA